MPPGKHALISVRQPKGNLIWIGTQPTQGTAAAGSLAVGGTSKNDKDKYVPKIHTWDECDRVQVFIENVLRSLVGTKGNRMEIILCMFLALHN